MTSPTRKRAPALLACLLTLAASGGDFSLARLALPSPTFGSEELPLDDPNTDFVAAGSLTARRQKVRGEDGPEGFGPTKAVSAQQARCLPLTPPIAGRARAPRAEHGTRLRC